MEWNSQQTEKPQLILKSCGFDTQNQSSAQLPDTMDYQMSNRRLLEISLSGQMTGASIFCHPPELLKNENENDSKDINMEIYSTPLSPEEINEHLDEFDTIEKINKEIQRLQGLLIQVESRDFKLKNPPPYVKQLIGYFTQLFKASLIKKENMMANHN